jgi:hypothetical protein
MSPNVGVLAATAVLLAFVSAHSFWRFFLRKQLPSLTHGLVPLLLFAYVGENFQANVLQTLPTPMAWFTLGVSALGVLLVVRFELKQPSPWN